MINPISFSPPDITQAEIDAVVDSLRAGWITTGPKTKDFERELAAYCGTARVACMNSATACMEMALRLLGIGPGDEVITSVYTYSASAAVIDHVGAKIVFVDTEPGSFHIDCEAVREAITERTKVIMPVDIGGAMCDYARLIAIAEEKRASFHPEGELQTALGRICILADAAHSFGSSRGGIYSGALADISCFSFHAIKNLTTAEGGAVTWRTFEGIDNEEIYRRLMLLSLHGQTKDALAKIQSPGAWEYDITLTGYKCNMTDMAAALGRVQLQRFPEMLKRREQITALYDAKLLGKGITALCHSGEGFRSNRHLYLARIEGAGEEKRNAVIRYLAERGVASNVHFKPLPLFTAYKNLGFDIADFPNAYAQYINEISLPLHTLLRDEDVERVCDTLLEAIREV